MNKINKIIPQRKTFMNDNSTLFEVNPLDVNLAKIQMNLIKRCEREVPENGDFAPVVESFKSLDPTIDLSEIIVKCQYDKNNSGLKDVNRVLTANISMRNGKTKDISFFSGTKKELLEYLNEKDFFKTSKANCLQE